jgi:hypothetical protein
MSDQVFKGKFEAQLNESSKVGVIMDIQIALADMNIPYRYEKSEAGHFFSVDIPNIDILQRIAAVFGSKIV